MGTLRYRQEDLLEHIPGQSARCFVCGEALVVDLGSKRSLNPGGFWASGDQWVFLCTKEECVERAIHLVVDAVFDGQIQSWLREADRRDRLKAASKGLVEKFQKIFWYKVTHLLTTEKRD
jgi:hypothetical protein